ncbi:hypothetical protein BD408DRAFT_427828 [Parasitella parasitica]|nr:hypothetical protein BD408DRAFT_427828 [Parasitella parasitica]
MLAPVLLPANSSGTGSAQGNKKQLMHEASEAIYTKAGYLQLRYRRGMAGFCNRLRDKLDNRFRVRYTKYIFQVNEEVGSGTAGAAKAINYVKGAGSDFAGQFAMKEISVMRQLEFFDVELNALDIMNEVKGLNLKHPNLM